MKSTIARKGIVETLYHAVRLAVGRLYSIVAVTLLKARGYGISWDAQIGGGNIFFQSSSHHIRTGNNVRFGRFTRLDAGFEGAITIADDVLIDDHCFITAQESISIGSGVLMAAYTFVTDFNHAFQSRKTRINKQGYETKAVVIEDDVWIGSHVVILPGVTIGQGAVIGAGSVVTKDIPPYTVAVGNPARPIKKRP